MKKFLKWFFMIIGAVATAFIALMTFLTIFDTFEGNYD